MAATLLHAGDLTLLQLLAVLLLFAGLPAALLLALGLAAYGLAASGGEARTRVQPEDSLEPDDTGGDRPAGP